MTGTIMALGATRLEVYSPLCSLPNSNRRISPHQRKQATARGFVRRVARLLTKLKSETVHRFYTPFIEAADRELQIAERYSIWREKLTNERESAHRARTEGLETEQ